MKKLVVLVLLLVGLYTSAQNEFQKGYLINNTGKKIKAFIENEQWVNNPEFINYKLTLDGDINTFSIEDVKEFSANKKFKFKRFNITIDDPQRQKDKEITAFLKAVVEGDQVSLYELKRNNQQRFYYQKGNQQITLLRYSESINAKGEVIRNYEYRKQLSENLYANCPNLSLDVAYTTFQLGNYIIYYNNCNQISESLIDFREYDLIGNWYFKAKGGVNIATIDVLNRTGRSGKQNGTNIRLGIEIEHFMRFKNKNWSVFLEPTFSSFKDDVLSINYSSIEIPIGIRKYIPIVDSSRMFLNAGGSAAIAFNATIDDFKLQPGLALFYGIGYEFGGTFSLEIRNYTSRSIISDNNLLTAEQTSNLGLIFGYKF